LCAQPGKILHFPVTIHAPAGLRKIVVFLGSKRIRRITFRGGNPPTRKRIVVTIRTRGFKPGLYRLRLVETDAKRRTVTERAHFSICKPIPIFTG
jgi:hypothetical protein